MTRKVSNQPDLVSERKAWRLVDAERVSGLSRSYFYKLESAGRLKLIRIGGRTLISDAELNRLLQLDEKGPAAPTVDDAA